MCFSLPRRWAYLSGWTLICRAGRASPVVARRGWHGFFRNFNPGSVIVGLMPSGDQNHLTAAALAHSPKEPRLAGEYHSILHVGVSRIACIAISPCRHFLLLLALVLLLLAHVLPLWALSIVVGNVLRIGTAG